MSLADKIRSALGEKKDDGHEQVACSFCLKGQDRVRKLIAGPSVYICDECIDLCNDIIAEESPEDSSNAGVAAPVASHCVACHLPKPATEVLAIPGAGVVCHSCADAIRSVADAALPLPTEASMLLTNCGPLAEQPCKLCGIVLQGASLLAIPDRGALCGACVDAVEAAVRNQHGKGTT